MQRESFSFTYKGLAVDAYAVKDTRQVHSAWIGPPPESYVEILKWYIEDHNEVMEYFETTNKKELEQLLEKEWDELELEAWEEFDKVANYDPY